MTTPRRPGRARGRIEARALDLLGRTDRWFGTHGTPIIIALLILAILLRALLVIHSPTPYGYVWDFYFEGTRVLYTQGRLPVAADCWVCYHPPLFFLASGGFYALGHALPPGSETAALRWTGVLSMLSTAATIYFGYRLLRLFRYRLALRTLGLAMLLAFPCLFISSYGAEADILLTAILSAFVYYLAKCAARRSVATTVDASRLGLLAGLAGATKASGLTALATLGLMTALFVARRGRRLEALRFGAIAVLVAVLVGGWSYADNWRRYGTALHANGTAAAGFAVARRTVRGMPYEFTTFRLAALRRAIGPNAQTGTTLTNLEVYKSVFTTLHALAWSDMGLFSINSRHGSSERPYPWKAIPPNLTVSVILLGLMPTALAALGIVVTLRRRSIQPLTMFGALTLAAYLWWVLPQPSWALKTKYILFLLPLYVLYLLAGMAWLVRRVPAAATVAATSMVVLLILVHVYLYAFALGHL